MPKKTDKKFIKACSEQSQRVYVAMSGGVDSSVSAALLKQAGFLVVGVYMKQWSPKVLGKECIWKQERQDAMRVAHKLGIKFLTWDFSKEYEREVGKYMIDSYKNGITPNPDVMCNKVIKFGLFFDKAIKEGADFIATGHYARILSACSPNQIFCTTKYSLGSDFPLTLARQRGLAHSRQFFASPAGSANHAKLPCEVHSKFTASFIKSNLFRLSLLKAVDKNKDQTYFLWTLKQKQLSKIIFPIGGLEKSEVRKLAKKFKLHNAQKKDSQGVCFIGQLNMHKFLQSYIKPKIGKIILINATPTLRRVGVRGEVIGNHDGVYYYTIGQRHGLDIKNGKGPYFVVKKDIKKNIIYVGKEKDLYSKKAKVKNINWIQKPKKFPVLLDVRTRYRAPLIKAKLYKNGELVFQKSDRAITSGQSAVFYLGKELLGGGVIK